MPLNYKEMLVQMRKIGVKNTQGAEITSVGMTTFSHIYNGHKVPGKQADFERLAIKFLSERITFPWSLNAATEMISVRTMGAARDHTKLVNHYAFSAHIMIDAVLSVFTDPNFDPKEADEDTWGAAFIGFYFILAMRGIRNAAVPKNFYQDEWGVLVKGIEKLLDTYPADETWVNFLRIKVAVANFNVIWNAMSKSNDERSSKDTREWVSKTGIRTLLLKYNDMIPYDIDAPFTAMAIASRFKDQGSYIDIQERLTVIDPSFGDPTSFTEKQFLSKYPEFDEDFSDFNSWAKSKNFKEAS